MRFIYIVACSATLAAAFRVHQSVEGQANESGSVDGEWGDPCKQVMYPARYVYQRLEEAKGKDVVYKSKYLPIEVGGKRVIFPKGGGEFEVDTSSVMVGAGVRYRISTNMDAADPDGAAAEDGDVVSGSEVTGWLKVEHKIASYVAQPVTALKVSKGENQVKLEVYPGQSWEADLRAEGRKNREKASIAWSLMPENGASLSIDFAKDVKYIKRVWNRPEKMKEFDTHVFDPEPATMEIHYKDGGVDSLYGGVHYDDATMQASVYQGSFHQFNSGVSATWKKKEKLNPKEKDLKDVRSACLKQSWCVGFQYNPNTQPSMVYFLDSWGSGPVGAHSSETSDMFQEETLLSEWVSYKYNEGTSDGVLLNPRLALTKYWSWVNKKKSDVMQKSVDFKMTDPDHIVNRDNLHDSVQGDGRIARAITKAGEKLIAKSEVRRENMVKTWAYREFNFVASEDLFEHLKCADSVKRCGSDILVPKGDECPL